MNPYDNYYSLIAIIMSATIGWCEIQGRDTNVLSSAVDDTYVREHHYCS